MLDSGGGRAATEVKSARRYLAEAAYRFNRRFRLRDMFPLLTTTLMRRKPRPEPRLRVAREFHG